MAGAGSTMGSTLAAGRSIKNYTRRCSDADADMVLPYDVNAENELASKILLQLPLIGSQPSLSLTSAHHIQCGTIGTYEEDLPFTFIFWGSYYLVGYFIGKDTNPWSYFSLHLCQISSELLDTSSCLQWGIIPVTHRSKAKGLISLMVATKASRAKSKATGDASLTSTTSPRDASTRDPSKAANSAPNVTTTAHATVADDKGCSVVLVSPPLVGIFKSASSTSSTPTETTSASKADAVEALASGIKSSDSTRAGPTAGNAVCCEVPADAEPTIVASTKDSSSDLMSSIAAVYAQSIAVVPPPTAGPTVANGIETTAMGSVTPAIVKPTSIDSGTRPTPVIAREGGFNTPTEAKPPSLAGSASLAMSSVRREAPTDADFTGVAANASSTTVANNSDAPLTGEAPTSATALTRDAQAIEPKSSSPTTDFGLPVDSVRDGLTSIAKDKASALDVGTVDLQSLRKPGLQTPLEASLGVHIQAPTSATASTQVANAIDSKPSSPVTDSGLPVDYNRDGLAVNSVDEAGPRSLSYGLESSTVVTPSGIDSNASPTVNSTVNRAGSASSVGKQRTKVSVWSNCADIDVQTSRKPGLQTLPEARLSTHTQAPTPATAPTQVDPTTQPDASAVESGARPPTGSTPRPEPHPFLTTKNAHVYAQDPQFEGLLIVCGDEEWPIKIQDLPFGAFITPRERGTSLQDEHLEAYHATKQLRDRELIRRVCDDWNYNAANSCTPNDLRHGPITVWPQGWVAATMRATCGDLARFWSKEVWLVAEVPMEVRIFDDAAAAEVDEWRASPKPFLPQAAVADAVAARLAKALALTHPRTKAPTYQDFVAADREQAARTGQASTLDLTLDGIVISPTNSACNPTAFTEWDKTKAAVDPSVERPRPKVPELVSVDHMPWYPMQPICVKKRLCNREHRDLEKLVEQSFSSLSRPRRNDGADTFDVKDTLLLLYILLTGEIPSQEEEMTLQLHGLPAKYIAFAVQQLTTGIDYVRICLKEHSCDSFATYNTWRALLR